MQCEIEVPENLRANFANFPAIFKNTLVSNFDIGDLMKNNAEEERILPQPRKILISSFTLQNGTLLTPLLCFIYNWVLFAQKYTALLSTQQRNASTVLCAVSSGRKKAS